MNKAIETHLASTAFATRCGLLLLALLMGGLWSSVAVAQNCTFTVQDLNFGNYDPLETTVAATATSTMTLDCNQNNTRVQITLSSGSSGTFAARTMRLGTSILSYNIFGDANFVFLWGDGSGNSFIRNVTVDKNRNLDVPMFGRIPPGQNPSVGPHADNIIVTLTF